MRSSQEVIKIDNGSRTLGLEKALIKKNPYKVCCYLVGGNLSLPQGPIPQHQPLCQAPTSHLGVVAGGFLSRRTLGVSLLRTADYEDENWGVEQGTGKAGGDGAEAPSVSSALCLNCQHPATVEAGRLDQVELC